MPSLRYRRKFASPLLSTQVVSVRAIRVSYLLPRFKPAYCTYRRPPGEPSPSLKYPTALIQTRLLYLQATSWSTPSLVKIPDGTYESRASFFLTLVNSPWKPSSSKHPSCKIVPSKHPSCKMFPSKHPSAYLGDSGMHALGVVPHWGNPSQIRVLSLWFRV